MGLGAAGTAAVAAAGIGAAGSIGGSLISQQGAKQSVATQEAALATEQGMAAPFAQWGGLAAGSLENMLVQPGGAMDIYSGAMGAAPSLTGANIAQMPGYQFTQQQGLLATQNAAAAQGLGVSGNALAAAGQYATNLASTNYQNYFNDYWSNQLNRYNMVAGLMQTGSNAAVGAGTNVANTAANIGTAQTNAATAGAAGVTGATNAASTALSNPLIANALFGSGSTLGSGMTSTGATVQAQQANQNTLSYFG